MNKMRNQFREYVPEDISLKELEETKKREVSEKLSPKGKSK